MEHPRPLPGPMLVKKQLRKKEPVNFQAAQSSFPLAGQRLQAAWDHAPSDSPSSKGLFTPALLSLLSSPQNQRVLNACLYLRSPLSQALAGNSTVAHSASRNWGDSAA